MFLYTFANIKAQKIPEKLLEEIIMQRLLIIFGILLLVVGLAWPWLSRLPFGRLPGDIIIERENFKLYFPLTTGLLISLLLSLLLWWSRK